MQWIVTWKAIGGKEVLGTVTAPSPEFARAIIEECLRGTTYPALLMRHNVDQPQAFDVKQVDVPSISMKFEQMMKYGI